MQDLHNTYTSRGRKPGARPGGVSRSRTEPLAPRAKGPAAPSTLAAKDHGRPTKRKALLWAGLGPTSADLHILCRMCTSTFGNTGKHRPGPGPDSDRAERRLHPQAPKGLVHQIKKHRFRGAFAYLYPL